jgi:hypothetical protein
MGIDPDSSGGCSRPRSTRPAPGRAWPGIFVPSFRPFADIGLEGLDAAVVGALQEIGGDEGEEAFHLVDPRGVGRGEVHVEPGMRREPLESPREPGPAPRRSR